MTTTSLDGDHESRREAPRGPGTRPASSTGATERGARDAAGRGVTTTIRGGTSCPSSPPARGRDLLQGLGRRSAGRLLARVAAEQRQLGVPAAAPRGERLPRDRPRPPRPRPLGAGTTWTTTP